MYNAIAIAITIIITITITINKIIAITKAIATT